jgi:V8-like Glu-specific endopeptidase
MTDDQQGDPRARPWRDEPDDPWLGTVVDLPPGEILRFERDHDDNSRPVVPYLPDDVPAAETPSLSPRRKAPRLRLGERDAQPLSIIGNTDDRHRYNDWRYPWGLICHVNSVDGVGSGVLVGPRHVLTASHCVSWDDLRMTVDVHLAWTTARAHAIVEAAGCYTRVREGHGFDQVDEDYAVLVLDQPFGQKFGSMGVRTYDSSWDGRELWDTFGYPTDNAGAGGISPTWQNNVSLDEDSLDYGWGRAISTNADVYRGQSGSPVFGFWDDGPYAVAVVVAEVGDENYCSGGVGLTALVNAVCAARP